MGPRGRRGLTVQKAGRAGPALGAGPGAYRGGRRLTYQAPDYAGCMYLIRRFFCGSAATALPRRHGPWSGRRRRRGASAGWRPLREQPWRELEKRVERGGGAC